MEAATLSLTPMVHRAEQSKAAAGMAKADVVTVQLKRQLCLGAVSGQQSLGISLNHTHSPQFSLHGPEASAGLQSPCGLGKHRCVFKKGQQDLGGRAP